MMEAFKICRKQCVRKVNILRTGVTKYHKPILLADSRESTDSASRKQASICLIHIVSFRFSFRYLRYMSSIVVSPKSQKELQFISELLSKLGVRSKVLSDEELEDLGLAVMMKDVDRSEVVGEDEIMQKLRAS